MAGHRDLFKYVEPPARPPAVKKTQKVAAPAVTIVKAPEAVVTKVETTPQAPSFPYRCIGTASSSCAGSESRASPSAWMDFRISASPSARSVKLHQ
jgi:hypothetical protein